MNAAIEEVDTMTQDQKHIADCAEIEDGIAGATQGFDALNRKLPSTKVNIAYEGFVRALSKLKPESAFEVNEEYNLKDTGKKIEVARKTNKNKLDEIVSRSDEATPAGKKNNMLMFVCNSTKIHTQFDKTTRNFECSECLNTLQVSSIL